MGNCCSIQYPKSTQEKYQQYKQNNRYACVNQSPLQWRKADKNEVKKCGESDFSSEDEKEENDHHHMSESCINDPQDWMKSQDVRNDNVDVEQECLLAQQPVSQNKKMVMKVQQRPNESKVIVKQQQKSEKKSSECSSHTSHSSIQDSSDTAETKKLIEKRESAVKGNTEISVRPKSRKVVEKPLDTTDGITETPHKKLSNALNTDKSLFVALDSGRDSDSTSNMLNSDASKSHTLPSKHKNKLPNVIKREKKSVEELIEAFKNDNSLIRAPCKEYLSDNLFEEAKIQHHQVLVSTLLPKYTPNTSFGSGRSVHGMEQSTFDIADIDSEDRCYNSKKYQHFQSMEVLHPVSTPKIEPKVKPKVGKGKIQLFDIGGFEDIAVGAAVAKSRASLSSISQSSERKLSVKSFQFEDGVEESVDLTREPSVEPLNLCSNTDFETNEDRLTNGNDSKDRGAIDDKERNETFNISNTSAKSTESKSENTTPRKVYEAKLASDSENTPRKNETSQHSDFNETPDKRRESSSKSFIGDFGYNDRKESEKSEKDLCSKSGNVSLTQPLNDSVFGDYPPLEISDKDSIADAKEDEDDDYFGFLKKKSAATDYDDIFGRSKKTMRSRDRGLNVLGKKSQASESDEFEKFEGDPFARGGLKHSPPRGYKFSTRKDSDEDDDFISNFNSLSGSSPKCKRSSNTSYAPLDFDDYGQKDDVFGDKSDEENKQPGDVDEGRSFRINNHVKVSKKGLSIEALGCELNLGKKVQLSLFNGKKSMLI